MRIILPLSLAAAALAALPGAATAAPNDVKVMSRNLYLGTDLLPPALAPNLDDLKAKVTQAQRNVEQTNFPLRAQRLAREIDRRKPDIIGLQEVTRFRTGPQNGGRNATTELYDWMDSLQRELRKVGERYRVAVSTTVADVEVPSAENTDLRITIGDAILVRRNSRVRVTNPRTGRFGETLKLTLANGSQVDFARTWESVEGRVAGRRFRFVNTHLEAFGDEIRTAQARQLVRGPLAVRSRPVILVGDLNSDKDDPTAGAAALRAVTRAGYRRAVRRDEPTSGFGELVNDPSGSVLRRTIDHVMVRPRLRTIASDTFGNSPSEKIGGLWPSDHAGVSATLRVR